MRSILQVRSDDRHWLDTALASGADAVSIGWAEEQDLGRVAQAVADDLRRARLAAHAPLLFLRLPSIDMAGVDDILQAVTDGLDGIVLGACRGRRDVQHLAVKLAVHEAECGRLDGETAILAEAGSTPQDLFMLVGYADASPRLRALVSNGPSLAHRLGTRGQALSSDAALSTARHMTLFAARAAGVALLDGISAETDDDLWARCEQLRADGFDAKFAASAAQVAIINATFDRADGPS